MLPLTGAELAAAPSDETEDARAGAGCAMLLAGLVAAGFKFAAAVVEEVASELRVM
jgi:hypothetical protein